MLFLKAQSHSPVDGSGYSHMDVNIHMTVGDCPQTFGVNLGTKYVKGKNNL